MPEGVHLAESSLADLRQLGEAYRAGEKALQKRIRIALQDSGKRLATDVPKKGAEQMPRRGGLAARIAAARGGVTVSLSSSRVSVSIRAKTREGYALRKIDQGQVRHPVWGRWVPGMAAQTVPSGAFSKAFEAAAPKTRDSLRDAVQKALRDIAGDAT